MDFFFFFSSSSSTPPTFGCKDDLSMWDGGVEGGGLGGLRVGPSLSMQSCFLYQLNIKTPGVSKQTFNIIEVWTCVRQSWWQIAPNCCIPHSWFMNFFCTLLVFWTNLSILMHVVAAYLMSSKKKPSIHSQLLLSDAFLTLGQKRRNITMYQNPKPELYSFFSSSSSVTFLPMVPGGGTVGLQMDFFFFSFSFSSFSSFTPPTFGCKDNLSMCTVLYCVLYCTVQYSTVLYCNVLYCTVLYCTVLYCTVQYYTVLYKNTPPPPKKKIPP